ncbi:hypothetical protein K488DRAFT_60169 [Vararia minispora EC-137]|uniref:Uncharacterized protein n=1 Tax=Vararia minispora EC-137 TaxID=1314806 RepID=A0ACB8Q850_9AGAM|nr:hypothetical protein K488DRAFT_60169 [Vararia minispora EC-137]
MPEDANLVPQDTSEEPEALRYTCEDSAERLAAINFSLNFASAVDTYWSPDYLATNPPDPYLLPPPEILHAVINHLGTSLLPKTQRDALRDVDHSSIEPILALYCPIEGGDYVIDNTVREIARRSKADVVVLDTVHLIAGESGRYGLGESGALLNFDDNPLYKRPVPRSRYYGYNSDEDDTVSPSTSSDAPHSPRLFFDLVVNITASASESTRAECRPRIIYVRDHPTLSDSLEQWWPHLQSAVQLRRHTASTSLSASIANRTVIVLGATPTGTFVLRYKGDDGANEDRNREEALRKTLKKWGAGENPLSAVTCLRNDAFNSVLSDEGAGSAFLRKTFLVPATRVPQQEKGTRVARRREINLLTMCKAAADLGAFLPKAYNAKEKDIMWDDWGQQRFPWQAMRAIAENAIGSAEIAAMARSLDGEADEECSVSFTLSWDDVRIKWIEERAWRDMRTSWTKAVEEKFDSEVEEGGETKSDEDVVERVKNADDLSDYERNLLACIVDPVSMTTTFDDVHLPSETIDAVRTLASLPLLHPDAFKQGILKQYSMNGLLLFGPPGVGKTHVIRALAKECGARMLAVQPSHIIHMYIGEGEKHVRAVFSLARRLSPCVMFIDELDAMFPERAADPSSASKAYRAIVTEFLQEMDGLLSKEDNVIVVGATNRPFDLDDAVLRRLPLRVMVELPDESQRETILRIHLRDEQLDDDVDLKRLANLTDRFSGSDLKNLVVSAALDSVKESVELPWKKAVKPLTEHTSSAVETAAIPPETPESTPLTSGPSSTETSSLEPTPTLDDKLNVLSTPFACKRILHWRNFAQALTEIWPSASEHLGTHTKLRDWNDKFGGGGHQREKDDIKGEPEVGDHEGALTKVRRAFDLSEAERSLLKCAVDPGTSLLASHAVSIMANGKQLRSPQRLKTSTSPRIPSMPSAP